MIENLRKYPSATLAGIAFYYSMGILGLALEVTRPYFEIAIPFTLLFSLYFLWLFHDNKNSRLYLSWLTIFVAGFAIEVIGVNTGHVFGEYSYGKILGVKIWGTPLMIGVNWLMLTYSSTVLVGLFFSNRWFRYLVAASLMVIYDIAMEPVAIRLDMWNWNLVDVPIQNYVAWFFISAVLLIIQELFIKRIENKIAPALFIIQFLFFTILNIVFRFI